MVSCGVFWRVSSQWLCSSMRLGRLLLCDADPIPIQPEAGAAPLPGGRLIETKWSTAAASEWAARRLQRPVDGRLLELEGAGAGGGCGEAASGGGVARWPHECACWPAPITWRRLIRGSRLLRREKSAASKPRDWPPLFPLAWNGSLHAVRCLNKYI